MKKDWIEVEIAELCELNPRLKNKESISPDLEIQFLPMKLVEEVSNKIHLSETRKFSEVQQKSYTYFAEGDVIFAKVTPCMENGKISVAKGLKNEIGYGSSEFHVFRPSKAINEILLFYFLVQSKFRNEAQHAMTGAVGLRRVPKLFLENHKFPLPPLPEQRAIVARIEELFSELDHAIANLKSAQAKLEIYRQAVLKKAFEGDYKIVTVGDLFEFRGGGTPSKSQQEFWNGDIPWASVKDIKGDYLNGTQDYISEEGLKNSSSILALAGEVILITRINPGKVIISNIDTAVNQDLKVIKPKRALEDKYILYLFKSIENECLKLSSGTTVLGINLQNLKSINIADIGGDMRFQIVQEIESRLSVADKLTETIQTNLLKSESLRQSILKKAFEGNLLTVAELESCRKEADWEPAEKLLERINGEKIKSNN